MPQAGWAHVPLRRPLLPRLGGRLRSDGRLRQARLRRGRDRRDPAVGPVRAGRRALLADTRLRPGRDPRAALARPPRPPHRRRTRRRGIRGAGGRVLRGARPPRRLAARSARLHLSGPGGGRLHRHRARARAPLHGGLARACLDRARARPGGRRGGSAGRARHGARADGRDRLHRLHPDLGRRDGTRRPAGAQHARLHRRRREPHARRPGRRRPRPRCGDRRGLRLAGRARGGLHGRSGRPVLRRTAARGPHGWVDPVGPRAGGHRRARVRRVRRVARPGAAHRRRPRPGGRANRAGAAQARTGSVEPLDQRRDPMKADLDGKVALVAGATRGAGRGTAVALGEAGATVYCTGRSTRERRSEYDRPETIEETAELVPAAGGVGIAVAVDHLETSEVGGLARRIDAEQGRLDVLVNDIWGAEGLFEWNAPVWEHDLEKGLRLLRLAIDTHLITSHHALPLLLREPGGLVVEMTDGTAEYNADHYRVNAFYDLAKTSVIRLAWSQAQELAPYGGTAVAITPGWMRSEAMLEHHGVSEENWRDATERTPHFCISETPRFAGRAV